jgi:hypothetical protein
MSVKGKRLAEGTRLFFGTSEEIAKLSPITGLHPEQVVAAHPKGLSRSRVNRKKDWLYLTTVYGAYFALCNTNPTERWGLIEVDLAALDRTALSPDDDYVRQLHRARLGSHSANGLTRWQDSLLDLGVCVYKADIQPAFIVRVAIFDPLSNPFITHEVSQAVPSIAGHRRDWKRCQTLTRWLMGENITWQDWVAESLAEDSEEGNRLGAGLQERSGLDIFYCRPVPKKVIRTRSSVAARPKAHHILVKNR